MGDDRALSIYMRELVTQAQVATIAAQQINATLAANYGGGTNEIFAAAQGLLTAGALMSAVLWPKPPAFDREGQPLDDEQRAARLRTLDRGRAVREALGIKSLRVLESKKVRNAIEHFDERIDRFFEAHPNANIVDRSVVPPGAIVAESTVDMHFLRSIDPTTLTISVLEEEVQLQELFDAITDIGGRAASWLASSRGDRLGCST